MHLLVRKGPSTSTFESSKNQSCHIIFLFMSLAVPSDANTFSLLGKGLKLTTAEDAAPHVAALSAYTHLERIVLSGNTIGVGAAEALAAALITHDRLLVLDLADIFTGRLLDEIPAALSAILTACLNKPRLHTLDLSDNAFGPAGAGPVAAFVSKHVPLRVLRLNNTGLGPAGGPMIADALVQLGTLCKQDGLQVFVAGRNRLQNDSCDKLARAFEAHSTSLRHVQIPQNGIRPEGVVQLAASLGACHELTFLDLQDNTFTDTGSLAVAAAMQGTDANNWSKLCELNLGDALLGKKGGMAIVRVLANQPLTLLKRLNLAYGELDEKTALLLAQAVRKMPALNKLELNGNKFDAESAGADAVRQALEEGGKEDALDSLSDMEEESEAEEEEEEDVDALASELAKQRV
jgi:Ran GTPase-activating protein 1